MAANILIYDVENMGVRGWAWGLYEQNLLHVDHQQHMLCISFKWLGAKRVHNYAIWDYKLYQQDPHNDKALAEAILPIIDRADVLIGHNIKKFDNKMIMGMFLRHHLPPPSPFKSIDTMTEARKLGRFTSNKLDDLGELMGHGNKQKHEGFGLWLKVDEGEKKAQKEMVRYNNRDVELTEQLYLSLRPYIDNHPSISLMDGRPDACPKCGKGPLIKSGLRFTKLGRQQRYQCTSCGGWCMSRKTETDKEVKYVN